MRRHPFVCVKYCNDEAKMFVCWVIRQVHKSLSNWENSLHFVTVPEIPSGSFQGGVSSKRRRDL